MSEDRILQLEKVNSKLGEELKIDQPRQEAVQAKVNEVAARNDALFTLNRELNGYENRAGGYERIMGTIRAYYEDGIPIQGDFVFNILRNSGVFAPGLDADSNLANFDKLFDGASYANTYKGRKVQKKVNEAREKIKDAVTSRLKTLEAAVTIEKQLLYKTADSLGREKGWGKYSKNTNKFGGKQ